jgi:hypothetical protein
MNIFETLDRESKARGLPFLVIGGHAVNAYGYARFTKDLDVLINREQRQAWLTALEQRGFAIDHDGGNFLQLTSPKGCKWPLDLMLVNASTFANLSRDAREVEIGSGKFRVPSLDSLFALKFHVLKQKVPGRGFKDLLDILTLAQGNAIDVRSERVKAICVKYGSPEIYEQVLAFNA